MIYIVKRKNMLIVGKFVFAYTIHWAYPPDKGLSFRIESTLYKPIFQRGYFTIAKRFL